MYLLNRLVRFVSIIFILGELKKEFSDSISEIKNLLFKSKTTKTPKKWFFFYFTLLILCYFFSIKFSIELIDFGNIFISLFHQVFLIS